MYSCLKRVDLISTDQFIVAILFEKYAVFHCIIKFYGHCHNMNYPPKHKINTELVRCSKVTEGKSSHSRKRWGGAKMSDKSIF